MPHVEQGELHALLDGAYGSDSVEGTRLRAHLASCANCQTLLEEERLVRERANQLLELAAPVAFEAPPFAQVQARAYQRSHRWGRNELGWAATIVLALGIGWFGHDLAARNGVEVVPSAIDQVPAESTEPAPPPAAPPPPEQAANQQRGAAQQQTEARREVPAATGSSRQLPAVEEAKVSGGAANLAGPPALAPAAVAQRALPEWIETTLENAERTLGRKVLLLPGYELVRLEIGVGNEAVRVFQRIPNDGMIELMQEPIIAAERMRAEAARRERSDFAAAADATAPVSLNVGNLKITARGPLAADSLRVLLGRLR